VKFVLQEQHIQSLNAVMLFSLLDTKQIPGQPKSFWWVCVTVSIIWELSWPSLHLLLEKKVQFPKYCVLKNWRQWTMSTINCVVHLCVILLNMLIFLL